MRSWESWESSVEDFGKEINLSILMFFLTPKVSEAKNPLETYFWGQLFLRSREQEKAKRNLLYAEILCQARKFKIVIDSELATFRFDVHFFQGLETRNKSLMGSPKMGPNIFDKIVPKRSLIIINLSIKYYKISIITIFHNFSWKKSSRILMENHPMENSPRQVKHALGSVAGIGIETRRCGLKPAGFLH